jgi:hypothetical protein
MIHTAYFGNIEWYRSILSALKTYGTTDALKDIIDAEEHWQKQTERNRCIIATANGTQMLSVPITVPDYAQKPVSTGDILISDHGNWRHLHWNALASAYGMSPFFDYYADDLKPFFSEKWEKLYDYNLAITNKVIELLGGDEIIKQCIFEKSTADAASAKPYYQTFQKRHGFIPNLSILDLLFNEGPASILYLKSQE